jgi:DnaJ-class molecular chaperone
MGEIEVKVEKGTTHGDKIKLQNMGIKKISNSKHRGNHFVIFNVVIPKKLNEEQSKLFEELADYEL